MLQIKVKSKSIDKVTNEGVDYKKYRSLPICVFEPHSYIITKNLQLCSVNVTVAVCFRVKYIMSNGFSQYVIDPDKSAYIQCAMLYEWYIIICFKITSPVSVLCRWRETFVNIPDKLFYTHMFKYVMKRKVIVYVCRTLPNKCMYCRVICCIIVLAYEM